MEDGELDFSNHEVFSSPNIGGEIPSSGSMDSFFDELLKDTHGCTHTHTCNPPGPDFSHTHTCYHVHTKIVPVTSEDQVNNTDDTAESAENGNGDNSGSSGKKGSKKRPIGNKEAVRKYREKKKARAASLEDEVVKLRALNQHLMRKLQGQAVLEAEVARLKCLLVDIRGRIEGEIGSFPYQKSNNSNMAGVNMPGSYVMNPCNLQCEDRVYCLQSEDGRIAEGGASLNGDGFGGCEFEGIQCLAGQNLGLKDLRGCGGGQAVSNVNSAPSNKRKGGSRAATAG
ncbi:basic leucine zipper 19-like [Lotus japonicus]|uniref:basic leucine zipper 19-like n=1 Tax=Lotus japonicus TaxID=34305 RepID=UPI002584BA16|nr:basic leucine zipper 19-like [Lotus japonicus]XP_057456542.1 basic leucine zipper 19-like [Lotus japonicus]